MRRLLPLVVALCALTGSMRLVAAARAGAWPAVVTRAFTGTYIEDIDIVRSGPLANFLVAAEGDGIYGAPLAARGPGALRKLADFRGVMENLPRGLAYLESQHAFAVVDGAACADLVIFDAGSGKATGRRTIQHMSGYAPDYCEGVKQIPASASQYPGDLLLASMDTPNGTARLEVLDPNGQVLQEIVPPALPPGVTLSAINFELPDAITVGVDGALDNGDAQIWTIDFQGNEVAPRVTLNQGFVEGMARTPDGHFVVTGVRSEMYLYDASLQPVAGGDRDYQLGFGWTGTRGIAWDAAAGKFAIVASDGGSENELLSMSATLDAVTPVVDLATVTDGTGNTWFPGLSGGASYISGENRVVIANQAGPLNRRGLFLFDGGTMTERIQLAGLTQPERPFRVEYLPDTNEFVVGFRGAAVPGVRVYSRAGALVRQFDPRPAGVTGIVGFAAYPAPDGTSRLVFFLPNDQAVITDAWGNQRGGFNWLTTLGVMEPGDVAYVTSGPYAGKLAVSEVSPGSVTIFTLP